MTTYELHARERKAAALADKCREFGITAQDIRDSRGCDDYEATWAQLAREAGVKPPSPETRRRVVEILEGK